MADLGEVARSTRRAATRCIRCGALGHATVVNIPVGCAEPVDVTCPWVEQRMCPAARATHRVGEGSP
ncbi:MAG: hypothetical protein KF764_08745 [Labilithrix sp.]|nr:hypothetical protein [Labilithrix sp.]